ncbi:hypothetical protein R9C00_27750 [Flammeovirgaceae bacterium SG7u.111]|nr:hypothetical protein [Flammeovirgaceae bacterium SG7u.132]WPO35496.1 hypothetical protein R9C00_27750 [Flammeovirgaceae bacterium SG7u.111]
MIPLAFGIVGIIATISIIIRFLPAKWFKEGFQSTLYFATEISVITAMFFMFLHVYSESDLIPLPVLCIIYVLSFSLRVWEFTKNKRIPSDS